MKSCFLCNPNKHLIFAERVPFFAILGVGPIIEGYSIIATTSHIHSMLDLSYEDAEALCKFTRSVREYLKPHYGKLIITEHGRVPLCEHTSAKNHDEHCFHAHRLLFPISINLTESLEECSLETWEYSNFIEAYKKSTVQKEYLYYERHDGSCLIAVVPTFLSRQFFRHKIAEFVGHPELANWKKYPQLKVVESAISHLLPNVKYHDLD